MSLFVISEILGLFVIKLIADDKYFLQTTENLPQPIEMKLSKKKKLLLNFFLHFWNVHQILNILKQEMILIFYVSPKTRTAKDVFR